MFAGATDMGDDRASERVRGGMSAASALFNAAAQAALERWPWPLLWEEVAEARARGEWDPLREFAGLPEGPLGEAILESPEHTSLRPGQPYASARYHKLELGHLTDFATGSRPARPS